MYFSLLTILFSGVSALVTFDFKKIIAFSTLRQLGLIFRIYCLGLFKLSFFHLLSHAIFKSLLFICRGVIIHLIKNFQDIRILGFIINYIPFTMLIFNISNLSLCGIYFLSGFYSKDLILESRLILNLNYYIFYLIYFSTILTIMYTIRLIYYRIIINFKFIAIIKFNESKFINLPIFILIFLSIFGGSLLNNLFYNSFDFIIIILLKFLKILLILLFLLGRIINYLNLINKFNKFIKYFFINLYYLNLLIFIFNSKIFNFIKNLMILFNDGWLEYFFINLNLYYFI